MIKLAQVLALIQVNRQAMQGIKAPGTGTTVEDLRWALLVTPTEVNELMDEIEADKDLRESISPEDIHKIRSCVMPLSLNGVYLFPEFPETMTEPSPPPLNG